MSKTPDFAHVLIVEDSMTTRRFLAQLVRETPGLMVVGEATDGLEAIRMTHELSPDVISMDIHMPRMDGIEAIQHIMQIKPTPIVVVSAGLNKTEMDLAMVAMEAGAVAALEKPTAAPHDEPHRRDFVRMLQLMSSITVIRRHNDTTKPLTKSLTPLIQTKPNTMPEIVVIGASAGGPGALAHVLGNLKADFPLPILVVQHLSAEFVTGLADWLDRRCSLAVKIAPEGEIPRSGEVWLAAGGHHMALGYEGQIVYQLEKGLYRHQPSVDMLFDSVAQHYGGRTIAVLLTGMGDDGAASMAKLYKAGARTLVQNRETSVVFGMPSAAIALGAAEYILPLPQIAKALEILSKPD